MNLGPTPDGEIFAPGQARLRQLGVWLRTNGEGIYGTRAGTLTLSDETSDPPAISGGVSTRSAQSSAHYAQILDGAVPISMFVDLPPDNMRMLSRRRSCATVAKCRGRFAATEIHFD